MFSPEMPEQIVSYRASVISPAKSSGIPVVSMPCAAGAAPQECTTRASKPSKKKLNVQGTSEESKIQNTTRVSKSNVSEHCDLKILANVTKLCA